MLRFRSVTPGSRKQDERGAVSAEISDGVGGEAEEGTDAKLPDGFGGGRGGVHNQARLSWRYRASNGFDSRLPDKTNHRCPRDTRKSRAARTMPGKRRALLRCLLFWLRLTISLSR